MIVFSFFFLSVRLCSCTKKVERGNHELEFFFLVFPCSLPLLLFLIFIYLFIFTGVLATYALRCSHLFTRQLLRGRLHELGWLGRRAGQAGSVCRDDCSARYYMRRASPPAASAETAFAKRINVTRKQYFIEQVAFNRKSPIAERKIQRTASHLLHVQERKISNRHTGQG